MARARASAPACVAVTRASSQTPCGPIDDVLEVEVDVGERGRGAPCRSAPRRRGPPSARRCPSPRRRSPRSASRSGREGRGCPPRSSASSRARGSPRTRRRVDGPTEELEDAVGGHRPLHITAAGARARRGRRRGARPGTIVERRLQILRMLESSTRPRAGPPRTGAAAIVHSVSPPFDRATTRLSALPLSPALSICPHAETATSTTTTTTTEHGVRNR